MEPSGTGLGLSFTYGSNMVQCCCQLASGLQALPVVGVHLEEVLTQDQQQPVEAGLSNPEELIVICIIGALPSVGPDEGQPLLLRSRGHPPPRVRLLAVHLKPQQEATQK